MTPKKFFHPQSKQGQTCELHYSQLSSIHSIRYRARDGNSAGESLKSIHIRVRLDVRSCSHGGRRASRWRQLRPSAFGQGRGGPFCRVRSRSESRSPLSSPMHSIAMREPRLHCIRNMRTVSDAREPNETMSLARAAWLA